MRGWNRDGYGTWSTNADFTIPANLPGVCDPVAPLGVVTNTLRPQFVWSAADRATWYRLWIARDGFKYCDTWIQGGQAWTPGWNLPDGNYDWWVRPWNGDGYADWSSAARFRQQYWLWTAYNFGNNSPGRYVVLGDSISATETAPATCWPDRLAVLLGRDVIDLAVPGQTAASGALRVADVLAAYQPGFLLILYGANDVIRGRSNVTTVEALRTIARAAKVNHTVPILATLTPMLGWHAMFDGDVDELNRLIVQMALQESVVLVRLDVAFGDGGAFLLSDGLHPNETGKALIARVFYDKLK